MIQDNRVIAGLAESWEYQKDTFTYTFHIRDGIRWHDGEPFTAEDVKFTIEAIQNPENGSENAPNYEDVEEITVIDDQTVAFRLSAQMWLFLEYIDDADFTEASSGGRGYAGLRLFPESDRYRPI